MRKRLPLLLLLAGGAAFAFGLFELFTLRFESGDIYPPYSSLRADPLGTMALYESLEKLPRLAPRRDFSATGRLPDGSDTVYLHLAAKPDDWASLDPDTFTEIEQFLAHGGRLVITMYPNSNAHRAARYDRDDSDPEADRPSKTRKLRKKSKPAKADRKKLPDPDDEKEPDSISIKERWGLEFGTVGLTRGAHDRYEPATVTRKTALPLPETLDWHSGIVLRDLAAAWKIIYARGSNAVVAERRFGAGTVVVAIDSYFLSNEALQRDRQLDFLAWLIGPEKKIVFDEAHLGVTESGGVATLMRKYHLEGLAAGLVLLAGLFIWKNSRSLVPPPPEETRETSIAGKEAAAGFVNLLRRGIQPRDLLATCFAEWKKAAAQSRKYSRSRLQHAEAIFEADKAGGTQHHNPLGTYQTICHALSNPRVAAPTPDPRPPTPT
jgi:hypothetical protein